MHNLLLPLPLVLLLLQDPSFLSSSSLFRSRAPLPPRDVAAHVAPRHLVLLHP